MELKDETFRRQQVVQTRNMVRESFNHPCVIIDAFLNECASYKPECKTLVDELIAAIRAENAGRLITYACNNGARDICNENTDIIAINSYPGGLPIKAGEPEDLEMVTRRELDKLVATFRERYPDKPIMVSESGNSAVYGWHDAAASISSEEMQDEYLTNVFETLWHNPDVCGFAIWQMNDTRTYSRTTRAYTGKVFMGHSQAGIFSESRMPKKSVGTVRKYFGQK